MIEEFLAYIEQNQLFSSDDKLLVAISGGVDSVVLAYLLMEINIDFGLAHCNFQLRGTASDGDAEFVENLAHKLGVPCFQKAFPTEELAQKESKNIQLIARELRYRWLEELRSDENFSLIATGHHADDQLETIVYNWTKGTGIRGLKGIPMKNHRIIRPLLFADKQSIEDYAKMNGISYRLDQSNASDKYDRNKIRHHVIPTLKQINPGLNQTGLKNAQLAEATEFFYLKGVEAIKKKVWQEERDGLIRIQTTPLIEQPFLKFLFYEWFAPYGMNNSQTEQLAKAIEGLSGSRFFTSTHEFLVNRKEILIRSVETSFSLESNYFIQWKEHYLEMPHGILLIAQKKLSPPEKLPEFSSDPYVVFLNLNEADFPLQLRTWQAGDRFKPLGMKGKQKKLKDYFNALKLSRFEKESVLLLETRNKEICWIIGHQISETFRLRNQIQQYYQLTFVMYTDRRKT